MELKTLTVRQVREIAQDHWGLCEYDMTCTRRSKDLARPRMAAMYAATKFTYESLPIIGTWFKRDHTTVMNARNRMEAVLEEGAGDATFYEQMVEYWQKCREAAAAAHEPKDDPPPPDASERNIEKLREIIRGQTDRISVLERQIQSLSQQVVDAENVESNIDNSARVLRRSVDRLESDNAMLREQIKNFKGELKIARAFSGGFQDVKVSKQPCVDTTGHVPQRDYPRTDASL